MMKFAIPFFAVFACFILTAPAPAQAKFALCNESSHVLDSALAMKMQKNKWIVRGWFRLYPGFCVDAIKNPLKQKTYYIHARSALEYAGPVRMFGGRGLFCISPRRDKFNITSRILCREKGYEKAGFARVEVQGRKWKKIFTETRPFHTRNHAMVAGIQRLLKENGLEVGDVDGYWGKVTRRSIVEFQRLERLRPDGLINEQLFEALLARAKKKLGVTIGLKLCNTTPYLVWAAIGYRAIGRKPDFDDQDFGSPDFESKGWLRVQPKKCAMMLREKLGQPRYYLYAEAVDEHGAEIRTKSGNPLAWFGDFQMCLTRLQFQIAGRAQCAQRGFETARFRRIETRGRGGWTEYLRENPS